MSRVIKKLQALIFLLAITTAGFSQNLHLIDSLRKELKGAEGQKKFDLLNTIGFEYRYSYPDSTIIYCKQAFELGQKLKIKKNLSKPVSFIGLAYTNKGDYKHSSEYHNHAIQVAIEQKDSVQLGHSYNNLGRMFFDGGDWVRSYDNLIRAQEIFEALHDKSGLAYVYRSMASIHKSQKDFANAIEMSEKAYKLRTELNDKRAIVSSLFELGLVYEAMGDTRQALEKFQKADTIAQDVNDKVTKAELMLGMAEIQYDMGEKDVSMRHASEVLKIISDETNQKLFARASLIKGRYYMDKKQYVLALPVLEQILSESRVSGNLAFQLEASRMAAVAYDRTGRKDKADELLTELTVLEEKIRNVDLLREIERLQFQLQMEKKEAENETLKRAQLANESLIAMHRFQNTVLWLAVICVSIVLFVLWMYSYKRKKTNTKLIAQNEQILAQQQEIFNTNEGLKKRNEQLRELNAEKDSLMSIVAHDLKSPLNRIFGVVRIMEMEGGLTTQQKEYLKLIKNATKSGNDLIIDLLDVNSFEAISSTPVYKPFNLGTLLEERVSLFRVSASIKFIELHLEHSFREEFVSDPDFLNRIIDNLISNAVKFSPKETKVEIRGKMVGSGAEISIRDNGPGFSQKDKGLLYQKFKKLTARPTAGESSNGLGLAIVKTLIDRLNAEIELISEPAKGSEFIIRIPYVKVTVPTT